jgi:aspartokinase
VASHLGASPEFRSRKAPEESARWTVLPDPRMLAARNSIERAKLLRHLIRIVKMMLGKSTLERAFEIAAFGEISSIRELERVLKAEGYDAKHVTFSGRALRRQLNSLMSNSRKKHETR